MLETRTGAITLKGTPTDLAGPQLKIGDAAPAFLLQNNALEDAKRKGDRNLRIRLVVILAILVLIFLYIIDFDLSIFLAS